MTDNSCAYEKEKQSGRYYTAFSFIYFECVSLAYMLYQETIQLK